MTIHCYCLSRLQYTLGDKLIPLVLLAEAETLGIALDNLGRAERLGWLPSLAEWTEARTLRNRKVHDYMENIKEFKLALQRVKQVMPLFLNTADNILLFMQGKHYIRHVS